VSREGRQRSAGGEGREGQPAGSESDSRMRALLQRRWIQRKANGAPARPAKIPEGGGVALEDGVRGRMEGQLDADLSNVRVHTGGKSEQAARQLGARAFTVDNEVHFNRGEFAPGSREGDRLLAHELTHVVQRKAEAPAAGGRMPVSQPQDASEHEADASADAVVDRLHGGNADKPKPMAAGSGLQRMIHRSPDENEGEESSQEGEPEGGGGGGEPQAATPGAEGPPKSPDELQAEELCQTAAALFALDVDEPTLPAQLRDLEPKIQEAAQKFGVEHAAGEAEAQAGGESGAEAESEAGAEAEGGAAAQALLPANSIIQQAASSLTQKKADLDKRLIEVWSEATQQIDGMGEDLAAWAPLPDLLQKAPLKQFIDNYPTNTSIVAIKAKHKQKMDQYDQKKAEAEVAAAAPPTAEGGDNVEAKPEEQAAQAPAQEPGAEPEAETQNDAPAPIVPAPAQEPSAQEGSTQGPEAENAEVQPPEADQTVASPDAQSAEVEADSEHEKEDEDQAAADPVVCAAVTGVSIEVAQKIIANIEADVPPWKCEEGRIGQTGWFTGSGDPYVMRPNQLAERPVTINAEVEVPPDVSIISTPDLHQIFEELGNTKFTLPIMEAQYRVQESIPEGQPLTGKQNKTVKSWRDGACRAGVWIEVANRVRASPGQVGIVELANCKFSPGRDGTFVVCADNRAINIPGGVAAIRAAMKQAAPDEGGGGAAPAEPPTT
jgi:hypothetical protein